MAIAWNSVFTTFADESATTFTVSYAPGTTVRGVFAIVLTPTHGTDLISGLTYGGVAMTGQTPVASDNVDEPGSAHFFHIGTGIPAGTNDVVITISGGANTQLRGVIGSVTASSTTSVADYDTISANQTNPQRTLTFTGNAAVCAGTYSGLAAPGSLTALASQTSLQSDDFGAHVTVCTRRTAIEASPVTIGWTAATDDVAMVAAAIIEDAAAVAKVPYRRQLTTVRM